MHQNAQFLDSSLHSVDIVSMIIVVYVLGEALKTAAYIRSIFFSTTKPNAKFLSRRHDSSIGFGAPVRANMRSGGVTDSAITSTLLEIVSAS